MVNKASQDKVRTRNWTFVIYPESVFQNWRDVLDNEYIQWVESPLHD
ncbi:Rep family protein, partial [Staphylococcus epidermidis]